MKLFLASSLDKVAPLLKARLPQPKIGDKLSVIFIANAADKHKEPHWWVEADRQVFKALGCELNEVDLRATEPEKLKELLAAADLIHVCGGSTLYLLSIMQKNGLMKTLADAVRDDEVMYTGTSAGSMIVAEDLTLAQYDDEEREFGAGVTDFRGLGLVNFLILPHSNNSAFVKTNQETIGHTAENGTPLLVINDGQAVWVEGNKLEILGK